MANKDQEKPDFAPKEYKTNFDFSDTDVGKQAAAAQTAAQKTHTVEGGESLSAIAEQELGAADRWREIYELNRDLIGKDPDLIQPGMELKLPA